ncbi:reductase, partial [Streptomyces sp. SID5785]|nr:reductase [Streptomyces sp. SID5785]
AAADASGDLGATVRTFTADLRTALLARYGDPDAAPAPSGPTAAHEVREITGGPLDAAAARHALLPLTVTASYDLTAPGHPRAKRFVRLRLPEGVTYRSGDHVTVLPAHEPALVERALTALGLDPDTVLDIRPTAPTRTALPVDRPVTVRELLTRHVELQHRPRSADLALLAAANPCPPEAAALAALPDTDPRTVLELVEDHPALRGALTWSQLLDLLPPLKPRTYSVSSSPARQPDHVDLMVSVLDAPAASGNGRYRGTGSTHLATL